MQWRSFLLLGTICPRCSNHSVVIEVTKFRIFRSESKILFYNLYTHSEWIWGTFPHWDVTLTKRSKGKKGWLKLWRGCLCVVNQTLSDMADWIKAFHYSFCWGFFLCFLICQSIGIHRIGALLIYVATSYSDSWILCGLAIPSQ